MNKVMDWERSKMYHVVARRCMIFRLQQAARQMKHYVLHT